ncbi:poly(ADP-ribose) polymerase family member 14-related sequence 1 isoform X3 [Nothobranchius furzeri]|uniref:Poly [ADP-ribose] polymerase n=1 Tax=Nothobranchius furzeri TaxID=105023 RepID=A0A9D3BNG8_NOTFU|nr:poly(ADP-ribose) polymerase family member 14-related sequence 1 isoform X3 [Nothobranchius furzeri]KAF7215051.1 transcript variant X2 [Nothobranchius furzeri]
MADGYAYPLLVELEDNNVSKLKIKLVKYFQSKKSNGGDCEVAHESGSRTAVVRFRREEDQKNVLAKETHHISLETGRVKMTVRLPSEAQNPQEDSPDNDKNSKVSVINKQPTAAERKPADGFKAEDEDTADGEPCSTSAVIENIPETLNKEYLEMLVENILKDLSSSAASRFTLEIIPDISCAVATFQNEKDKTKFIAKCPQNRMFTRKNLSVRPLEVTTRVLVEGLSNIDTDVLQLYFENKGGEVEDVKLTDAEQSAVITFTNRLAVKKVLERRHNIREEEVKVYPFYESLEAALYGDDTPSPKLPAGISELVEVALLRYLTTNKMAVDVVRRDMAKHFCDVNLVKSAVRLSPVSSLLKEKNAKAIIKEWADTVKSAFAQSMSKFKSLKLPLESEVWNKSEEKIRQTLENEDVVVVPDKATGVLSVAGLVDDVSRLENPLSEILKITELRVQREKSSKTQDIKVLPSIYHILSQDGIQNKLLQVYPELKVSYDKQTMALKVTGFVDEILGASNMINQAMLALRRQNLELGTHLFDMLRDENQEEITDNLLTAYAINAALEISPQRLQLVAVADDDLVAAEDHLKQHLISKEVVVEDSEVLKLPEWQQLVSRLEKANSKSGGRIQINTTHQQVIVSGHKDSVISVSDELDEFLTENAHTEEVVAVRANVIIEYLKSQASWLEIFEGNVCVSLSYAKEAIIVSGPRAAVQSSRVIMEGIVNSVDLDSLKVEKPGVKKFFRSKESMYVSLIKNETDCLVKLVDEVGEEQDGFAFVQVHTPVYQIQTADGVEIAVFKADMCTYPVDAVVSPSNEDLKHSGGLAGALFKAGGPQLQNECDKLISMKGKLKPGESLITDASGQLYCKKVIHTFGPTFDQAKAAKSEAKLKRAVKGSLELAESIGCFSVALPAISRNQGFPLNLCLSTIVNAVKEYCDERYEDSTLKKIHLVDNDDNVILAMESAVKQLFGNQGVSLPQQIPPNRVNKLPPVQPGESDYLCHVKTKEGLDIVLKKGNIEAAKTDVIVNTVFEDLALNKGAVSTAIFNVAGPKLQQLVSDQKSVGIPGDIIVTESCKLKSKQVFHVVAPHMNNDQASAGKILGGIFKDCLDMAENARLASISFPAIGTGNLGFPKDIVASLMLNNISDFSSQTQPKHLKKVAIILYPKDAQTIQEFIKEFMQKFPNASGGLVSKSPSQSTAGSFSKVVSTSGMQEAKMGNVTVQVSSGDITKETTDVIVNSSNEDFSLKSGVSKAILDAAGAAVEVECQNLGSQTNPGMIMTQPGNLKCKKILHLVGQTDPVKINRVVKEALQMCVKHSHTSVSFPAIGTGQGNVQAKQVADAMLDAVIDVLKQNPTSTLTLVRIVIFQQPMLNDFYRSMQEKEASDPKDKVGFWGRVKSFFVGSTETEREEDFVIDEVKMDPACFHICGDSPAKVKDAKQKLLDLISDEQHSHTISDDSILSFSPADRQQIAAIQKKLGVSIKTDNKNGEASIIIEGLNRDVLKAHTEIDRMLKKVKDEQGTKQKVELTSNLVEWQYQRQGLQFHSFDVLTNYQLEQAMENNQPNIKVMIRGQTYTVTLPNGPATDGKKNTLQIRRLDKLKGNDIPDFWDPIPPGTTCLSVPIQAGTPEYTEVQNQFKATCNRSISKIERIQNPTLWKGLQIKKQEMEVRNGHQNNEKRLFHGTSETTVRTINEHGFNRSYAGLNATCYGKGSYFAVTASYSSQDTYSRPNGKGEKFMYLCRVLTGDATLGQQNLIAPPSKQATSSNLYDSVVDQMPNPSMYVVFHDIQAYPEYLITFT